MSIANPQKNRKVGNLKTIGDAFYIYIYISCWKHVLGKSSFISKCDPNKPISWNGNHDPLIGNATPRKEPPRNLEERPSGLENDFLTYLKWLCWGSIPTANHEARIAAVDVRFKSYVLTSPIFSKAARSPWSLPGCPFCHPSSPAADRTAALKNPPTEGLQVLGPLGPSSPCSKWPTV